jgi:hypothetical protein
MRCHSHRRLTLARASNSLNNVGAGAGQVYEETGFQIPDGLITEEDYIEFTKNEQRVRAVRSGRMMGCLHFQSLSTSIHTRVICAQTHTHTHNTHTTHTSVSRVRAQVRLYIVPYVSENTPFAPRTRKEISVLPPPSRWRRRRRRRCVDDGDDGAACC